jgi:O-antigen/teichoic acid export membrane protein
MTLHSKITRNSIIQLIGKLISLFLGLATVAIMTRYLGDTGYGYYTTVTAFLQVFGILVDFGLSLTAVQMISKTGADVNKALSNIMTFRAISAVIFIGLAPIAVLFFPYPAIIKLGVLVTALSFFSNSMLSSLTSVFQKELKMFQLTVAEVTGRLVLVGLTALFAVLGKGILWILATISIANALTLILAYLFAKKYVTIKWAFDWDVWKELIKRTWPMALSISFNLIYLRMDVVILSLVRDQSEVGLYGAAYRVVDILTLLPAVYMGIILPHATNFFHDKKFADLFSLLQKAFNSLMLFGVPIVCGAFLVSDKVMTLVAGRDFYFSGEILKILIFATGAIFVTSLFGYAVVAIDKQRSMMWGYLTAAVLTLTGYLILIPKFGWQGAAWMTVFSESLIAVWTGVMVYKTIKFFPNLIFTLKSLIASGLMVGVIYLIKEWNVLIILSVASVVYFSLMVAMKALGRNFFKQLFLMKENN